MSNNPNICECMQWCRSINTKYLTNHHENCLHYNDSIIDIWKIISIDGILCCVDNERDAMEYTLKCQDDEFLVVKEKMHREAFEALKEFNGF